MLLEEKFLSDLTLCDRIQYPNDWAWPSFCPHTKKHLPFSFSFLIIMAGLVCGDKVFYPSSEGFYLLPHRKMRTTQEFAFPAMTSRSTHAQSRKTLQSPHHCISNFPWVLIVETNAKCGPSFAWSFRTLMLTQHSKIVIQNFILVHLVKQSFL